MNKILTPYMINNHLIKSKTAFKIYVKLNKADTEIR